MSLLRRGRKSRVSLEKLTDGNGDASPYTVLTTIGDDTSLKVRNLQRDSILTADCAQGIGHCQAPSLVRPSPSSTQIATHGW